MKNNQKTKKLSFTQVITGEYKIILLFTAIIMLIPTIIAVSTVSDINHFLGLKLLDKLKELAGNGSIQMIDRVLMHRIMLVASIIVVPLMATIIAIKLNGKRLIHAVRDGVKAVASFRFWNYVLKIYLPILVITFGGYFAATKFVDKTALYKSIFKIAESPVLAILFVIIVLLIALIVMTICGLLFIGNIVYMRGANRIKTAIVNIKTREVLKILGLSLVLVLITFGSIFAILMSLYAIDQPLKLIAAIIPTTRSIILIKLTMGWIGTFLTLCLYLNSASKTELLPTKEPKDKEVKKISKLDK